MGHFEHGKWYLHMRDHQLERAKQSERLRDWELGWISQEKRSI